MSDTNYDRPSSGIDIGDRVSESPPAPLTSSKNRRVVPFEADEPFICEFCDAVVEVTPYRCPALGLLWVGRRFDTRSFRTVPARFSVKSVLD